MKKVVIGLVLFFSFFWATLVNAQWQGGYNPYNPLLVLQQQQWFHHFQPRYIPESAYPLGDGRLLETYLNSYFEHERAKFQAYLASVEAQLLDAQTRNLDAQRKLLEAQKEGALPPTPSTNQRRKEAPQFLP